MCSLPPWLLVHDATATRSLAFRSEKEWLAVADFAGCQSPARGGVLQVAHSTFRALAKGLALRRELPTLTTREAVLAALRAGQPVVQLDWRALVEALADVDQKEIQFVMKDTWRIVRRGRPISL